MVTLAARKNLCINSSISALSPEALNQACLDLQDAKTPQSQRCRFLPKDDALKYTFRDHALANIQDIEDLVQLGKELQVCPYYSTRLAIPPAEIVALPYPLLLNKAARMSLGIDLRENVVIIDEAHNLLDAINSISSSVVRMSHLRKGQVALKQYMDKFSTRLKGKNEMYIAQLNRLISGLVEFLSCHTGNGQVMPLELLRKGVDAVNIHDLARYLRTSKLARKIDSYAEAELIAGPIPEAKTTPVLTVIQGFLDCLVNPAKEGVFFYEASEDGEMSLKYLLLNPCHKFSDIVEEARSIVLAGGTMEPISDFLTMLFPQSLDRIKAFTCGHVIPDSNLVAFVLGNGPSSVEFEFTFAARQSVPMLKDLGRAILNLISAIPDGVVVFFASYNFLSFVRQVWVNEGIYPMLNKRKSIFLESKDISVEETLGDYTASVESGSGGLLLAVVGGKMSEGINFSDALGRAVIMVGLPFPNAHTAEWEAKLSYVEKSSISRALSTGSTQTEALAAGRESRQEHYENVAMRAVNQSIGRAIRHQSDYASIILIDKRYGTERISKKLPKWIRSGLQSGILTFPKALQQVGRFFKDKKVS